MLVYALKNFFPFKFNLGMAGILGLLTLYTLPESPYGLLLTLALAEEDKTIGGLGDNCGLIIALPD